MKASMMIQPSSIDTMDARAHPKPMTKRIKLMIVDDSVIIRQALTASLKASERFEVVAEAANGKEALVLAAAEKPDVITLDIEMPEMDGLTVLKHLMVANPIPTVMLSSLTQQGAEASFDALRLGAVDFIPKPTSYNSGDTSERINGLYAKLEQAATLPMSNVQFIRTQEFTGQKKAGESCNNVIIIGASEGGYAPLLKIIPSLQAGLNTAVLIVLYEKENHVNAFADYMNRYSAMNIMRAESGTALQGNCCYLCSGYEYTTMHAKNVNWVLHVEDAPFHTHNGATDMMMFSASELCGSGTTGVILSGLGHDGAEGLEEIFRVGGQGLILDTNECMYTEMPAYCQQNNANAPVMDTNGIINELNQIIS